MFVSRVESALRCVLSFYLRLMCSAVCFECLPYVKSALRCVLNVYLMFKVLCGVFRMFVSRVESALRCVLSVYLRLMCSAVCFECLPYV